MSDAREEGAGRMLSAAELFAGPGELRQALRDLPWETTPLGAVETWPPTLQIGARLVTHCALSSCLVIGPERVLLFNDALREAVDASPSSLGRPVHEVWAESWALIEHEMTAVFGGDSVRGEDRSFGPARPAGAEERFWTYTLSPLHGDAGDVLAVFCVAVESTARIQAERTVRESESRYREFIEQARDFAIVHMDADGRIRTWSPGAQAVYGFAGEEVIGSPADVIFVPEDRATGEPTKELERARRHRTAADVRWHQRRDGSRVFVQGSTRALGEPPGRDGFLKIGLDITRQRQLDEQLAASEARFRTMADLVPDLLMESDAAGATTWVNRRWQQYTGEGSAGVAAGWLDAVHPADREQTRDAWGRAVAAGVAWRREVRLRRADGVHRWHLVQWEPLRDERGQIGRWLGAAMDVDEQHRALDAAEASVSTAESARLLVERRVAERTAELAEANARLAEEVAERARGEEERTLLRRRLVSAEEDQRRRIARELHDQLGQHLTAFGLGLEELHRVGGATLAPQLSRLSELTRQMAHDARFLALELRPPELDDIGLESALESYVSQWSERYGIEVELAVRALGGGEPAGETGTTLYRVAQEALTNVARHASATRVSVILEQGGGETRLIVEDDGGGFDAEATIARARREGRLGIAGMQERAELVGGRLTLESRPGAGTTVFVAIPVSDS